MITEGNLRTVLQKIAEYLEVDDLYDYAMEDNIGGYHTDPSKALFSMGSIWGVEGQILYAIVRALKPTSVLELGTFNGCSTLHIAAALRVVERETGKSVKLVTVDDGSQPSENVTIPHDFVEMVKSDAIEYVNKSDEKFDLVFEDSKHTEGYVAKLYDSLSDLITSRTIFVSHDAAHPTVGQKIVSGIVAAGFSPLVVRADPSDCGLAIMDVYGAEEDPSEEIWTRADIESMTKDEISDQLSAYGVGADDVKGSGKGGNVLKSDLVDALLEAQKGTAF